MNQPDPNHSMLPLVQEIVRTYQAFTALSTRHIRSLGLTTAQFDVIVTLGNTPGLASKTLGEKTLITKGTLTGVLDRLESKGLIRREIPPEDRRSYTIMLTPNGEALFQQIFPAHLAFLSAHFSTLTPDQLHHYAATLRSLRQLF